MKFSVERKWSHLPILSLALSTLLLYAGGFSTAAAGGGGSPATVNPSGAVGQYTGPGSCSSPSCHGSVRPRVETRIWQNEYSVWITRDKHARAYAVLSNPVATRMARILGLAAANTAPKCLACHALNVPPDKRAQTFDMSDGVSCESCHGPAAGWLGAHTARGWTHEQSLALGMYDTRALVRRTEKCMTCHLGNEERFVDHEMIAAGHPDLFFELDSFSAVLPRHWKEPLDKNPWRDVQEWGTGQAVQLREALVRLAGRTQMKSWPEFSELECFACHHDLTAAEQSWRQERGYPGRRPGDPPWNASRYAVFRDLVRQTNPRAADQLDAHLNTLAKQMSALVPDRKTVAAEANASAEVVGGLTRQIESLPYDQALTLRLLRAISGDADAISGQGERAGEQAAMALDSLFTAYTKNDRLANQTEIRTAINGLFQLVQNPSAYNPYTFAKQMRRVNELLR